jgi:hypothetical protein
MKEKTRMRFGTYIIRQSKEIMFDKTEQLITPKGPEKHKLLIRLACL